MRLFVALDLPEKVRQQMRELIGPLKTEYPGARWVRPEGMHITLKFIGHVDAERVDPIRAALETIRSEQPVDMEFRGLGFFPNERRPRVAWCGVKASPNLPKLAADIERALEPLGIPLESRNFVPHLTLARFKADAGDRGADQLIGKLVQAAKKLEPAGFGTATETEFHLYESVLRPSGAEYTRLHSFSFVKGCA